MLRTAPAPVPFPESEGESVCVLPDWLPLLSVTVRYAVNDVGVGGSNVTLMVQLAPAARVAVEAGQLFVCKKAAGVLSVNPMLLMVRAAFPLLVNVAVWAALVVSSA